MPKVAKSNIVGYREGNSIYCKKCGEKLGITGDLQNVITKRSLELETLEPISYYCDDCGELFATNG